MQLINALHVHLLGLLFEITMLEWMVNVLAQLHIMMMELKFVKNVITVA